MSTQSCNPTSPIYGQPRAAIPASPKPALGILEAAQAPDQGLLARVWRAFCNWRRDAQMRNLTAEMDTHQLKDVGAPEWLVYEATVKRDLERLRSAHYIRW